MPSGSGLRSKVTSVLRRLHATSRDVYLRTVEVTGGDPLLGVGRTESVTDTLLDPQPAIDLVPGDLVATSGGLYQLGDYKLILSAESVDAETLRNTMIRYGDELLDIQKFEPVAFGGLIVAWEVVARPVKESVA